MQIEQIQFEYTLHPFQVKIETQLPLLKHIQLQIPMQILQAQINMELQSKNPFPVQWKHQEQRIYPRILGTDPNMGTLFVGTNVYYLFLGTLTNHG